MIRAFKPSSAVVCCTAPLRSTAALLQRRNIFTPSALLSTIQSAHRTYNRHHTKHQGHLRKCFPLSTWSSTRFCSTALHDAQKSNDATRDNHNSTLENYFGAPLVGKGLHLANFIKYIEQEQSKKVEKDGGGSDGGSEDSEHYTRLLDTFASHRSGDGTKKHLMLIKGRLERLRVRGNVAFAVLRQPPTGDTIQIVFSHNSNAHRQPQEQQSLNQPHDESVSSPPQSKSIVKAIKKVNVESVIEVYGELRAAEATVLSCTCQHYELHVHEGLLAEVAGTQTQNDTTENSSKCSTNGGDTCEVPPLLRVISPAQAPLPFPLQDPTTKLNTKLNARSFDLRTSLSNSIFQLSGQVGYHFRRLLDGLAFVEIHTPKLIPAASEGSGSSVFRVENYFSSPPAQSNSKSSNDTVVSQAVYLAQSPQLYKQMAVVGDLLRTYEVGPVFRAEKSFTHRHLCEFTGLDAEFVINDDYASHFIESISSQVAGSVSKQGASQNTSINTSYFQVLDVLEYVVCGVIKGLQTSPESKKLIAKVAECMQRVQENDNDTAQSDSDTQNGSESSNDASIVFEVPSDIIELYHLPYDTPEMNDNSYCHNTKTDGNSKVPSTDPYRARLGGGGASPFSAKKSGHNCTNAESPKVLRMTFDDAVQLLKDSDAFAEEKMFNEQNNTPDSRTNSNLNNNNNDAIGAADGDVFIDDFSLFLEKKLGVLIKKRYKVDVYVIDQFYFTARPFYTLPLSLAHHETAFVSGDSSHNEGEPKKKDKKKKNKMKETADSRKGQEQQSEDGTKSEDKFASSAVKEEETYDFNRAIESLTTNPCQNGNNNNNSHINYAHLKTCSFDMYLRGEEICSGAQRIHNKQLLMFNCGPQKKNLPPVAVQEDLQDYMNAFCYGSWPHGGFGLGLERIVLFFLQLDDIRRCSLFPRDPRRVRP